MGVIDLGYRTISCNGPDCGKTLTFLMTKEEHAKMLADPANAWVKTLRTVDTSDGRKLAYCSDVCEAKGIQSGTHNIPEPSRIITGVANAAQVQAAADAAKAAEAADKAIRAGQPANIQIAQ